MWQPPLQLPYLDVAVPVRRQRQLGWLLFSLYVLRSLLLLGRLELQQQQLLPGRVLVLLMHDQEEGVGLVVLFLVVAERARPVEQVLREVEQVLREDEAEREEEADRLYDASSELLVRLVAADDEPPGTTQQA